MNLCSAAPSTRHTSSGSGTDLFGRVVFAAIIMDGHDIEMVDAFVTFRP